MSLDWPSLLVGGVVGAVFGWVVAKLIDGAQNGLKRLWARIRQAKATALARQDFEVTTTEDPLRARLTNVGGRVFALQVRSRVKSNSEVVIHWGDPVSLRNGESVLIPLPDRPRFALELRWKRHWWQRAMNHDAIAGSTIRANGAVSLRLRRTLQLGRSEWWVNSEHVDATLEQFDREYESSI